MAIYAELLLELCVNFSVMNMNAVGSRIDYTRYFSYALVKFRDFSVEQAAATLAATWGSEVSRCRNPKP